MICRAFGFFFRRGVRLCLFASALVFGGLLAHAVISKPIIGSGKPATEDRPIGDTTEVVISGECKLNIIQGDIPRLRVTADDNILPLLETKTSNGKLTVRTKSGFSVHHKTPVLYTLVAPRLEKLTISGVGDAEATGLVRDSLAVKVSGAGNLTLNDIECKTLTLTLSGAGNATLAGKVDKVDVQLSGVGEINGAKLKAASADIRISGAGNAKIWATEELKARISGAGDIQYKGNPHLDKKVSGAGSVKSFDE